MNRTAMCIRMLQLLKSRGFMRRDEIAAELEVNRRNIAEYRKELEAAGYTILSTRGRNGGYALLQDAMLVSMPLQESEKQGLREAQTYLRSHPDFISGKTACIAIDKILSDVPYQNMHTGFYLPQDTIRISNKIQEYIEMIQTAVKHRQCVELTYRSMKDAKEKTFRIHPYEILHDKGAYYCIAYSLPAKAYRTYKFSEERMKNCVLLDQYFNRDADFDLKQHIGSMHLVKDEIIEVELEIYHEAAIYAAERSIGLHPRHEWINDHTLRYQAIFEGSKEAIGFVLSLGSSIQVLRPQSLRQEVIKQAREMLACYKENDDNITSESEPINTSDEINGSTFE